VSDGRVYAGEWTPAGALRCGKYVAPIDGRHRNVMVGEWLEAGVFVGRVSLLRTPPPPASDGPAASASSDQQPHTPAKEEAAEPSGAGEEEAETEGEVVEVSEGRFDRGLLRHGRRAVTGADGSEVVYEGQFDEHGVLVQGARTQIAAGASSFALLEEGTFRDGTAQPCRVSSCPVLRWLKRSPRTAPVTRRLSGQGQADDGGPRRGRRGVEPRDRGVRRYGEEHRRHARGGHVRQGPTDQGQAHPRYALLGCP
jgi:hypothetical protein